MTLDDAVRQFVDPGTLVLVAVSGGPDSMALLHALQAATPVEAAHLNHQLRGAESDADEAFVAAFCRERSIPCHVHRLNVAEQAADAGANLEGFARQLRYDWLCGIAARLSAPFIATGHTQGDQAETVLFNLLRGTGLRGLRGIAFRRVLAPGIEGIRPLLMVTRQDVLDYLSQHGLPAREDSTNHDLAYTRNRIRHELLPLLRAQFNPAVDLALVRLAEQAREMLDAQQQRVLALLAKAELPRAGGMIVLELGQLAELQRHDLRELFCLVWERENWSRSAMGHVEWERLAELALGQGTAWDMPGGVSARRQGRVLQLVRGAV